MRLIKQDGTFDILYENVPLSVEQCFDRWLIVAFYNNHELSLGSYGNKQKAIRVLEMVGEKYSQLETLKITYRDGMLSDWEKEFGFNKLQETFRPIFKFPKDDEVVVDG